jgi:hypothetical protein
MVWLCTDQDGDECISIRKPTRNNDEHRQSFWFDIYIVRGIPKGSIKRLIGRELTWDDEPVEFTEVIMCT